MTDAAARPEGRPPGIQLDPHQVILRPNNQYAFEVNPLADKDAIRSAVELLFNVHVLRVRTQHRKGKPRRYRFKYGRTKDWKKAVVTLDKEHRINFF